MRDYGRNIEFGISVVPEAADVGLITDLVEAADRLGLDLVGIQDHPYQRRFLDTWSLLAALAARTERIRLFPDVANLPLRPAPMMAKAAASLDVLSGGRFELGLGAGAFWPAIAAMGGREMSGKESVDALEEAIDVMRAMWSADGSVSFDGRHYRLAGHKPGPAPLHPIGIWLGARGPRMLRLTGGVADGWIPSRSWAPPEDLADYHDRIDDAAGAAGRDPAAVKRLYNVAGRIAPSGRGADPLQGPADQWAQALAEWVLEYGMDTFIFWPEEPSVAQVEAFGQDVVPAVRSAVEAARS